PQLTRGRYLVEALGHCGECHTPRNLLGGMTKSKWLAGGSAPEGDGKIPNITPHDDGIVSWSESDIVYYLETGFTPDFDSVGGSMVSVQENMARLPKSDLEAIARYLKSVPAAPSE
ncbi:MAG: c-type cytochrome, partial [Rhizobiaceae bacterium]